MTSNVVCASNPACRYFSEIGVNVVFSLQTDSRISAKGVEMALAQPCYPVQVAHGHVDAVVDIGVDYVFVPNVLDAESSEDSECVSHFCPWNQTLPFVLQSAPGLEEHNEKFLAPSLHFQLGREHVKRSMAEMAKRLGEATDELLLAMERLEDNPMVAMDHARRTKHRENQIERIYRRAVADLFDTAHDADDVLRLLRIREVYRHVNNAADRADMAANVIGAAIVKMT